ncbi:hypothetical protein RCL1_000599 [Eukaryota sp. TZLM3-RCL]
MYNLQNLLSQTSSNPLLPPNSLDLVRRCFDELCNLLLQNILQHQSIHIPRFGTFHVSQIVHDLGTLEKSREYSLSFSLDPSFRRRHRFSQLRVSSSDVKPPKDVSFIQLSSKVATSKETAQDVVKLLVDSLSDAVSLNQTVCIVFGSLGKFIVKNRKPSFSFSEVVKKDVQLGTRHRYSMTNTEVTTKKVFKPPASTPSQAPPSTQGVSEEPTNRPPSRIQSATLSKALTPPRPASSLNGSSKCVQNPNVSIQYCDCDSCSNRGDNVFAKRPITPPYDPLAYRKALDYQLNTTREQKKRDLMMEFEQEKVALEELKRRDDEERKMNEVRCVEERRKALEEMKLQMEKKTSFEDDSMSEHFPIIEKEDVPKILKQKFDQNITIRDFQIAQMKAKKEQELREKLEDQQREVEKLNKIKAMEDEERRRLEEERQKSRLTSLDLQKSINFDGFSAADDVLPFVKCVSELENERIQREKATRTALENRRLADEKKMTTTSLLSELKSFVPRAFEQEKPEVQTSPEVKVKRRQELIEQMIAKRSICPKCLKPKKPCDC